MKDWAMNEGDKPKTDMPTAAAEATETDSGEQENKDDKVEEGLKSEEVGGPNGLEPTRYGDWERKGRCIDF